MTTLRSRNYLYYSLVATIFVSAISIRQEASALFTYYFEFRDHAIQECERNIAFYRNNRNIKTKTEAERETYDYVLSRYVSRDLISALEEKDKISPAQLSDAELNRVCLHYRSDQLMVHYIAEWSGIKDAPKVANAVNFYALKVSFNLLTAPLGALFIILIMRAIRNTSEGLFRLFTALMIPLAIIPHLLPSYSIIATPITQSFTYPATVLLALFLSYKLIKWIRDGFRSG